MQHTATVETLTAEVRVLQVGNRQITTSVANQLDHLDDTALIEPMGRVRLSSVKCILCKKANPFLGPQVPDYLIGSHKTTGDLILLGPCALLPAFKYIQDTYPPGKDVKDMKVFVAEVITWIRKQPLIVLAGLR